MGLEETVNTLLYRAHMIERLLHDPSGFRFRWDGREFTPERIIGEDSVTLSIDIAIDRPSETASFDIVLDGEVLFMRYFGYDLHLVVGDTLNLAWTLQVNAPEWV